MEATTKCLSYNESNGHSHILLQLLTNSCIAPFLPAEYSCNFFFSDCIHENLSLLFGQHKTQHASVIIRLANYFLIDSPQDLASSEH